MFISWFSFDRPNPNPTNPTPPQTQTQANPNPTQALAGACFVPLRGFPGDRWVWVRGGGVLPETADRSRGKGHPASTGVLLGWGVRDSVFLVVVGSGGATRRHPSCSSSGETNGLHMPRRARRDPSCSSSDETDGHYMPRRPAATHRVQVRTKPTVTTCQEKPAAIHRV